MQQFTAIPPTSDTVGQSADDICKAALTYILDDNFQVTLGCTNNVEKSAVLMIVGNCKYGFIIKIIMN